MADKLVSVNDDYDFPAPVAARQSERQAARLGDATTPEGKALATSFTGVGADSSIPYAGIVPANFTKWRAALAKVRTGAGAAKLLCVGDSTTWGIGSGAANAPDASYPAQLTKLINSYLAPAKPGLTVPPSSHAAEATDSRWNPGAGWTKGPQGWGLGSAYSAPNGTTTPLTFTPGINCDTMDVYYLTASSGRANLSIDGGTVVQTAGPLGQGIDKTTITTAPGANHVLTVNNVTGGTAHIIGVDAYLSSEKTVRVGNAGVGGSESFQWTSYPDLPHTPVSCIKKYAPDLTIIMLGINDAWAGYETAKVAANLQTLITAAKKSGDVLLASVVPSGPNYGANVVKMEKEYRLAQINLATTNNIGFVDIFSRFGSWEVAKANGFMAENALTADLHPGANGYADMASAMFSTIRALG